MDTLTPEMWSSIVARLGEPNARAWAQQTGVPIPGEAAPQATPPTMPANAAPGMDMDTANLSQPDPNAGLAVTGPGGAPPGPSSPISSPLAVEGGDEISSRDVMAHYDKVAHMRQQMFDEATKALTKQRAGPGLTEQLFALSSAFAQPTRTKGFSGVMGNVMPVLAKYSAASTDAKESRADKLLALRQKYLEGGIENEGDILKNRIELAKLKKQGSDMQWSDSAKTFFPKSSAAPNGEFSVINGMRANHYTDGTKRIRGPSGRTAVYDATGKMVYIIDAEGNRTDAQR